MDVNVNVFLCMLLETVDKPWFLWLPGLFLELKKRDLFDWL